jgi:hypothetical protein
VLPSSGAPFPGLSWRSFVFRIHHVGPFGGHKNATQTKELLRRVVTWPRMGHDVEVWCDRCWTCILYRKRGSRLPAGIIVCRGRTPWGHVHIDFEGPITPADVAGYTRICTYICTLTGASLLTPLLDLPVAGAARDLSVDVPRQDRRRVVEP